MSIKDNNANPYPKYSYNSGLVNSDGSAVYGMDIDYVFYEVEHGRLPELQEE